MPRVLVANALDSSLGFYDATTRKALKSLKVGKSPHGIAVARNRKYGFVANTGDGSLSVVDVVRMAETGRLAPDGMEEPAGIVALADGRNLFTTSKTRPVAYVVDTKGPKADPVGLPAPACTQVASLQGGKRLCLVLPEAKRLVAVDPRTRSIVDEHTLPGTPAGLSCARDQRNILVTFTDPPRLSMLDPSSGDVLVEVEVSGGPSLVKPHPYKSGAFVLTAFGVQPVDLEEGTAQDPIPAGAKPNDFDVARAGKVLYVISADGNTLSVVEAEKRSIRDTWETGHHPTAVVFIP